MMAIINELETIIELVHDGVLIADANGKILFQNSNSDSLIDVLVEYMDKISALEGFALDEKSKLLLSLSKVNKTLNEGSQSWKINTNETGSIDVKVSVFKCIENQLFWIGLKKDLPEVQTQKNSQFDSSSSLFLSNIAHEIRTPLNGIIGFAELLLKKTVTAEKQKEFLSIIYSNGNYLMQLITEMLDLSRLEAGKLQLFKTQFSINRLLYELQLFFLLDMKNKQKAHIQLKVEPGFADGSDLIHADELRIKQVLINLLGNSIKFTLKGGITISYKSISYDTLQFCIKDTGLGMTNEAQKRIFERFIQADDSIEHHFGGSGIGLTISKELVEMHNGEIWVESVLNEGTSFFFTLPCR